MIIIIITSRNNLHSLIKGKESLQEVGNRIGCIREPKAGLCDNLEGWDAERGGRGSTRRAHMYACGRSMMTYGRDQQYIVKQLLCYHIAPYNETFLSVPSKSKTQINSAKVYKASKQQA